MRTLQLYLFSPKKPRRAAEILPVDESPTLDETDGLGTAVSQDRHSGHTCCAVCGAPLRDGRKCGLHREASHV